MDKTALSIGQIRELLPHRYPMLMVDRITEIGEDGVVGEKLVSANEPFFQGHFPGQPIMPGVLIVEAIGQATAVWVFHTEPHNRGRDFALVGVNKVRFRRPVVPGDVLRLSSRLLKRRDVIYRFEGTASVRGETIAEAEFTAAFVNWEEMV